MVSTQQWLHLFALAPRYQLLEGEECRGAQMSSGAVVAL